MHPGCCTNSEVRRRWSRGSAAEPGGRDHRRRADDQLAAFSVGRGSSALSRVALARAAGSPEREPRDRQQRAGRGLGGAPPPVGV